MAAYSGNMPDANIEYDYLQAFAASVGETRAASLRRRVRALSFSATRTFYHDIQQRRQLERGGISGLSICGDQHSAALVVENIDLDWISTLGAKFEIDPAFFAAHLANLPGQTPWNAVFGKWSADHRKPTRIDIRRFPYQPFSRESDPRVSWHVDGVVEHSHYNAPHKSSMSFTDPNFVSRNLVYDTKYGWQATTRISYCLLHSSLCTPDLSQYVLLWR
jgi:hypothetical protein